MDIYLCNDSDIDAERCRVSLQRKSPITIFARDARGRIACFTGIVCSMHFDHGRATGQRWRVVLHEAVNDERAAASLSPSIDGDAPMKEQKQAKT
jgi:hypothetical protein